MSHAGDSPPMSQIDTPVSFEELIYGVRSSLTSIRDTMKKHVSPFVITCWTYEERVMGLGFSVTTSPKGGIDIKIGYDTIHVCKYTSAHHPVVQMLLFAKKLSWNILTPNRYKHTHHVELNSTTSDTLLGSEGVFVIAKSMVLPQTIIGMFKKKSSCSTSPKTYEAGWSPAKSRNVATLEDTSVGSNGGSSEPTPVNMGSMISAVGPDLTVLASQESLHEQNITDSPGGSTGNTTMICSAHKQDVQRQIHDTEPKNHRGPVLLAARDDGSSNCLVGYILMLGRSIAGAPVAANPGNRARVFLIDSAATVHATGDYTALSEPILEKTGRKIGVANGHELEICGLGSVNFGTFTLTDVKYIPGLTRNVISVSMLMKQNYMTDFQPNGCFIIDAQKQVVGHAREVNGLWELEHA